MSAIPTLVEGERAVRLSDSGERAEELDSVVFRYLPMFYKRAFRFLGNAADAEDAVQDALALRLQAFGAVQRASAAFNLVNDNRQQRRADAATPPPRWLRFAGRKARGRRSHSLRTAT